MIHRAGNEITVGDDTHRLLTRLESGDRKGAWYVLGSDGKLWVVEQEQDGGGWRYVVPQ
jgi:hypothetical protein